MKKLYLLAAYIYASCAFVCASSANATLTNFESSWGNFTTSTSSGTIKSFTRRSGSTPSSGTGPTSGAENSNYYAYLETSYGSAYTKGDTAYLTSASITASHLSFYYHMYGSDIGTLAVEKSTSSGWKRIWEISGQQQTSNSAPWIKQTLALSLKPEAHKIRFVAIAKGSYRGDIALDQIKFESAAQPSVTYHYDALGRLVTVEDVIIGNKQYQYDPAGNRKEFIGQANEPVANTAPTARNDSVSVRGMYSAYRVNVLSNDTDVDGDQLTITSINNSDGRISVSNAGGGNIDVVVVYSSSTSFSTGFSYTVSDGKAQSSATVTVYYSNY